MYEKGDKILVVQTFDADGNEIYYPSDYVRRTPLWILLIAFIFSVLIVAKMRGLRALLVLGASVLVIVLFIVSRIVNGANPLLITIIGTSVIGVLAIFFTHGFNKKSKIAFYALITSLVIVFILSQAFVSIANLTGLGDEESMFLSGFTNLNIDVRGLLLAGIIIGALGVLDDVVISQVSIVEELRKANQQLGRGELYKRAMKVGTDHINSMINTLFLAYAGASLPLLILFSIDGQVSFTLGQILNNEAIATEIIRTLTGSIGLVLAVPISTYLAVGVDPIY